MKSRNTWSARCCAGRNLPRRTILLAALFVSPVAADAADDHESPEQVVVVGQHGYPVVDSVSPPYSEVVDTAELLRQLPGASLNGNGTLSGVAQYRGLYGDRVAVSVDGLGLVTGGPNAMDAPLSYASPLLLEHLSLERGIASVSSAPESVGGHIKVAYDRGEFRDAPEFGFSGAVRTRHATNGNLGSTAARLVAANHRHRVTFLGQRDSAGDLEFPGGRLKPTRLHRERHEISYGLSAGRVQGLVFAGRLDTRDTGTPSLPMDIRYIDTALYGARLSAEFGRTRLDVAVGYSDVEHVMDNHALRNPPAMPAGFRETLAEGDGYDFRLGTLTRLGAGELQLGIDGRRADYSAIITNPNVPAFRIDNFAGVERDVTGLYLQWNHAAGEFDYEAGVRVNRVVSASGPASAVIPAMNPMMEMMAANAAQLADAFNAGATDRRDTNVDAVFKLARVVGKGRNVFVEVARKTRSPSYQELYLWLPLESTGGLADGRNYLGDPTLKVEVVKGINAGLDWASQRVWFSPQIFYQRVSDYIQGVPSADPVANAVAMMMSGAPALQFANTDARIHGLDVGWGVYAGDSFVIDGVVSYARGRRTDERDNLYRLAPAGLQLGIRYEADSWMAGLDFVANASQRRVAAYNGERSTGSHAIVNASFHWELRSGLRLSAAATNLLDRRYRDHLGGINRAALTDVPVGERLFGPGRSFSLGAQYSW